DAAQRLVRRLAGALPQPAHGVVAHGDFHVDQLLRTPAGLTILDFDQLCLACLALDVATYPAHVVRWREADDADVQAALAAVLAGYGRPPADLRWHLAAVIVTRAAHPFQYQAEAWRERTAATLAAAARVLEGLLDAAEERRLVHRPGPDG